MKIIYKGIFPAESETKERTYILEIPKRGKIDKNAVLTGDYKSEYRIIYPDSSIIYITNDEWNGSRLNIQNRMAIGINGYTKKTLTDTIEVHGVQENGRYWKELILNDIVVGYYNLPEEHKQLFDEVLTKIKRVK